VAADGAGSAHKPEEERRKRSALQGYLHKAHERRMQIADAEAAAPAARAARAAERNALLAVQKGGAAGGVKARPPIPPSY